MKLDIQSIHFTADQKLIDFIQQKVDKLETFYDRFVDGEVFLRVQKNSDNSRDNKVVEIKLRIPGDTLVAKKHGVSFEAATDEATESLRRQVKKYKEKILDKSGA
ncbi:ribosome-associated translation inhibitor RaiA [Flammeovirga yaeyamensis]|uniref:Ribosome-associated translation inhibitor RaiA n=1 Tax=Flammeovirga yaeyamensis TaxID=367791 RepID=A0AAX1N4U8_9BACT|nr:MULTISPECIES: ribosome-associated translation inhibitor RaiA [Flammeovirga]ANQ50090.1 ribosome-associated translation inhibitor RaiA [Flammeovirga sp. MY04]MBB3700390.1 putative sigma-54 modulation protein [Flammeovirga yaeyamensis]NMF36984.1 ribosome-associated translation inhibitor RaiA [Flammeovirga yaeyamensis]QWG02472.1 ribosome-associated translation inhibitor RaiA [Flammeovirga yaeyamensis]